MEASAASPASRPGSVFGRIRVALAALGAGILGVAPHVLHHVGPLAGAALFAGFGGTLLFGSIGFVLAIPTLVTIRRRTGGWRASAGALALMATVFSLSTFVIGPAIAGGGESADGAGPAPAGPERAPAGGGHEGHH